MAPFFRTVNSIEVAGSTCSRIESTANMRTSSEKPTIMSRFLPALSGSFRFTAFAVFCCMCGCVLVVFIFITSHLVRCFLAEDAGGHEHEHYDEQHERERVAERRPAQAFDEVLADADDERADHCSRNGAYAAEHRGYERLEPRHGAHRGGDARVVREEEYGANRRKEGAYDERGADDAVELYAHELRGLEVAGDGAHRHADL